MLLLVVGMDKGFGFCQILCGQLALHSHEFLHQRLILFEELVIAFGHGAGDDKRCAGIVNQHRVDLVDDGVIVLALYQIGGRHCHVVAQVVETKFIVCTECDVGLISAAACFRIRLVLVDAIDAQTVEHVERTHPFGVALGQIVVHRYDVNAIACEGVEEHRQSGYEGFTFTRCHFGDFSLVKHNAAEELHIIVHHVPKRVVATCNPVVLIDGLVVLDADKVVSRCQIAVEVGSSYHNLFVFRKAACRFFHNGEGIGQSVCECFFVAFKHFFLEFVDLIEDYFAIFQGSAFNFSLEGLDFLLDVVG